jgi:hypothetical protein
MKTPIYGVGFPWISLDSLVRIETYQWVTLDKSEKVFRIGFSVMSAATGQEPGSVACESAALSWRKSISISNFLQSIAVQAGFPQRLNPNAARSRCAGANAAKPKNPAWRLS